MTRCFMCHDHLDRDPISVNCDSDFNHEGVVSRGAVNTGHPSNLLGAALMALVLIGVFLFRPLPANAAPTVGTILTFQPTDEHISDGEAIYIAELVTLSGEPVQNGTITLFSGASFIGEALTDWQGQAWFMVSTDQLVPSAELKAVFMGLPDHLPSSTVLRHTSLEEQSTTVLSLQPVLLPALGELPTIRLHLSKASGEPISNVPLSVVIRGTDDERKRKSETDELGQAQIRMPRDILPGSYRVTVAFDGTAELLPASAIMYLNIATPTATVLTVQPLEPLMLGAHPKVFAKLTDIRGAPLVGQTVRLYRDRNEERRARTGEDGFAVFTISRDLPIGEYDLEVRFAGRPGLLASSTNDVLKIVPAVLAIETVPPLPGVTFSLDGQTFLSDERGVARIEVRAHGTYRVGVRSFDPPAADVRVRFHRWEDKVFTAYRDVVVPPAKTLQAGFNVSYQVSQSFVDLEGRPFPRERVESLVLKSSHGTTHTITDGKPLWLQAGRVVKRRFGLEETRILYSLMSVMVDGTNVVNRQQQRFFAHPNDEWELELLLYSAHFTARDALFRFPIGTGVSLKFPSGKTEQHEFGSADELSIYSLARGFYQVQVIDPFGFAPVQPVALSRNQQVELLVVSYLDMAVGVVVLASIAIGLLLIGRPWIITITRRLLRGELPKFGQNRSQEAPEGIGILALQQRRNKDVDEVFVNGHKNGSLPEYVDDLS